MGHRGVDVTWDGVLQGKDLAPDAASLRHRLANAARDARWTEVFSILDAHPGVVNSCRPDGSEQFAPLHQAAFVGADASIVERLIAAGAWRTLQTARGESAMEVAARRGHAHLFPALKPVLHHDVPPEVLLRIQARFHEVIVGRIREPLPGLTLRLPELAPLLELGRPHMWFPVPGMYGGFSYTFERTGAAATLVSESWWRVVGGSGQRHEITSGGTRLVAEGFV